MHYINKSKVDFSLFINQLMLLFSILLLCSGCFEHIKCKGKKTEEYKGPIGLKQLDIIPNKAFSGPSIEEGQRIRKQTAIKWKETAEDNPDDAWARQIEDQIKEECGGQSYQDYLFQDQQSQEAEAFMNQLYSDSETKNYIPDKQERNTNQAHETKKDSHASQEEENKCNICFEIFNERRIKILLSCCMYKQSICSDCINQLSDCPYCRKKLN